MICCAELRGAELRGTSFAGGTAEQHTVGRQGEGVKRWKYRLREIHSHSFATHFFSQISNTKRKATSTSHHGVSKERPAGICLPGAATSSALHAPLYHPICSRPRHHATQPSQTRNVGHASARASSFPDTVKIRRVYREHNTIMSIC